MATVSAILPSTGSVAGYTSVVILGSDFQSGCVANVGGSDLPTTFVGSGMLLATTAAHAEGAADVTVTNPDASSDTLEGGFTFAVLPPRVDMIDPAAGGALGGDAVFVYGGDFQPGAAVAFDGVPATGVSFGNDTLLSCNTPAHAAGAVGVTVTNPDELSDTLEGGFTYGAAAAPTVSFCSPDRGPESGGTEVLVGGTGFASGCTVAFGGEPAASVSVGSSTWLTCESPSHDPGYVDVTVTNSDEQSGTLTDGFLYEAAAVGPPAGSRSTLGVGV